LDETGSGVDFCILDYQITVLRTTILEEKRSKLTWYTALAGFKCHCIQWITTQCQNNGCLLSQVCPWGTADGGMNAAVRASILAGIMYLIAAGVNSNGNAVSP